jgi:hypothetical protein
MATIPELKKKITSFLAKEDGKISKDALIKTGILLGAAAVASLQAGAVCPVQSGQGDDGWTYHDHCNALALAHNQTTGDVKATHTNDHSSHAAHGSHGSHSSNGSPW